MKTYYPDLLGAYLAEQYPNHTGPFGPIQLQNDSDGNGPWIRAWPEELGPPPTPEQVAAWQPSPIPPVAAALAAREQVAAKAITNLKATAAVSLVAGGMSEAEAYGAGTALVVQHAALIQAFVLAGGNAAAGQALINAIEANPPSWWGPAMLAIFQAALV